MEMESGDLKQMMQQILQQNKEILEKQSRLQEQHQTLSEQHQTLQEEHHKFREEHQQSSEKLHRHIDFIERVYESLAHPIDYFKATIDKWTGRQSSALPQSSQLTTVIPSGLFAESCEEHY
jgi:chromosome segregation ATPase